LEYFQSLLEEETPEEEEAAAEAEQDEEEEPEESEEEESEDSESEEESDDNESDEGGTDEGGEEESPSGSGSGLPEGELYISRKGDWIGSIAMKFNILDPATVYDYSPNQPLRTKRPDMNLLADSDEMFVPVEEQLSAPTKGKNNGAVTITVTSPEQENLTVKYQN